MVTMTRLRTDRRGEDSVCHFALSWFYLIHAGAFAPDYSESSDSPSAHAHGANSTGRFRARIPPGMSKLDVSDSTRQFNRALSHPTTRPDANCRRDGLAAPIQPGAFAPDYRSRFCVVSSALPCANSTGRFRARLRSSRRSQTTKAQDAANSTGRFRSRLPAAFADLALYAAMRQFNRALSLPTTRLPLARRD